jgi:hypothetical protein
MDFKGAGEVGMVVNGLALLLVAPSFPPISRDLERSIMSAQDDLCYLPASSLATSLLARKVSPAEVVDGLADRIKRLNPKLNAYVSLDLDKVRGSLRRTLSCSRWAIPFCAGRYNGAEPRFFHSPWADGIAHDDFVILWKALSTCADSPSESPGLVHSGPVRWAYAFGLM